MPIMKISYRRFFILTKLIYIERHETKQINRMYKLQNKEKICNFCFNILKYFLD